MSTIQRRQLRLVLGFSLLGAWVGCYPWTMIGPPPLFSVFEAVVWTVVGVAMSVFGVIAAHLDGKAGGADGR